MSWYVEVYNVALLVLFHTKKISSSTQLIKKMFLMLQNYSLKVFELFSRVGHQPFFFPLLSFSSNKTFFTFGFMHDLHDPMHLKNK